MAINNQNAGGPNPANTPAQTPAVKAESQVNQKMQSSGGMLNAILVIVLIGLAVFGTFLSFDKGNVLNKTTELEKNITDLKAQVDTYKSQKVEVSKNASDALDKIEQNEIIWSQVIAEVDRLMPHDASGADKVQVVSYSDSANGRIATNIVTLPAPNPPFDIVSGLLSTFNNSVFFKDAYIPSISKGTTDNGQATLSFVLNMQYQKPDTGTADINLTGTPVENSVKVPRTDTAISTEDNTPKVPNSN